MEDDSYLLDLSLSLLSIYLSKQWSDGIYDVDLYIGSRFLSEDVGKTIVSFEICDTDVSYLSD